MNKSGPRFGRIALSYVNPTLDFAKNGRISAHRFFHETTEEVAFMQASVDQLWRGGVRLVVLSHGINEPDLFPGSAGIDYMLRCLDALLLEIEAHPDCVLLLKRNDLTQAERRDKLAIALQLTGCPINGSLQALRSYVRLGVRSIHPFIRDDTFGSDCGREQSAGLTREGETLLREMESLGALMDVAHANDRTFSDVLALAQKPIMDSHTGCRAILNHPRNRTDEQLAQLGGAGGVAGVHFASHLLAPVKDAHRKEQIEKMESIVADMQAGSREAYSFLSKRYDPQRWPRVLGGAVDDGVEPKRAKLGCLVEHIDRLIQTAGADHVCIGSDYALGNICQGVETADRLPDLDVLLQQCGYSEQDREKVMYGNLRNLLMETLPQ